MKKNINLILNLATGMALAIGAISCENAHDSATTSKNVAASNETSLSRYPKPDAIEEILKDVDPRTYRLELGQLPKNSLIKRSSYGSLPYDKFVEIDNEKITVEKLIRKFPPAMRGCFDVINLEKIRELLSLIDPIRYENINIQKISGEEGFLYRKLDRVEQLFQDVDLRNYRLEFGNVQTNDLAKQTSYGAFPLEKIAQIYSERGFVGMPDPEGDLKGCPTCPPHYIGIRIHRYAELDKLQDILTKLDIKFKGLQIDQVSNEEIIMIPQMKN